MRAEATIPTVSSTAALAVRDLTVRARKAGDLVEIVDGVAFEVMPGEAVAIVGESGSGKSVSVRAALGLLPGELTVAGELEVAGRQIGTPGRRGTQPLHGAEIGFVMQDPFTMLNPSLTCGQILTARLRDQRGAKKGRGYRQRAIEWLAEVGIADAHVVDQYPFELSGGMRQRVAIAAALSGQPRVLVADEPTTALDVTSQAQILDLLDGLRRSRRLALVLVTHDLRVAASICDRVYVMYAGKVVEEMHGARLLNAAAHPYTAGLVAADPPLEQRLLRLPTIVGAVPSPGERPAGCRFAPRCEIAVDICREKEPPLIALGRDHRTRCHRAGEGLPGRPVPVSATPAAAAEGAVLVRTHEARRVYGHKVALAAASVEIRAGESVGIVGESGSGKSTLARMIVGLEHPTSGRVDVAGIDVHGASRREMETVRATVQMAFQDPSSTLNPFRAVGSTIAEAVALSGSDDIRGRTRELLDLVGLNATYAPRRPRQLSGGERQRIAIARALARNPRVMVCDEVVSALDVSVQAHILNLLNELRDKLGLAYVFITHDLAVARQVTDRLYVLRSGEIVETGTTDQVLSHPNHPYTRDLLASVPDPERTSTPTLAGPAEGESTCPR